MTEQMDPRGPEPTEEPRRYEPPAAEELPERDGTVETAEGGFTRGDA
jgi:hypothetical protein